MNTSFNYDAFILGFEKYAEDLVKNSRYPGDSMSTPSGSTNTPPIIPSGSTNTPPITPAAPTPPSPPAGGIKPSRPPISSGHAKPSPIFGGYRPRSITFGPPVTQRGWRPPSRQQIGPRGQFNYAGSSAPQYAINPEVKNGKFDWANAPLNTPINTPYGMGTFVDRGDKRGRGLFLHRPGLNNEGGFMTSPRLAEKDWFARRADGSPIYNPSRSEPAAPKPNLGGSIPPSRSQRYHDFLNQYPAGVQGANMDNFDTIGQPVRYSDWASKQMERPGVFKQPSYAEFQKAMSQPPPSAAPTPAPARNSYARPITYDDYSRARAIPAGHATVERVYGPQDGNTYKDFETRYDNSSNPPPSLPPVPPGFPANNSAPVNAPWRSTPQANPVQPTRTTVMH